MIIGSVHGWQLESGSFPWSGTDRKQMGVPLGKFGQIFYFNKKLVFGRKKLCVDTVDFILPLCVSPVIVSIIRDTCLS